MNYSNLYNISISFVLLKKGDLACGSPTGFLEKSSGNGIFLLRFLFKKFLRVGKPINQWIWAGKTR